MQKAFVLLASDKTVGRESETLIAASYQLSIGSVKSISKAEPRYGRSAPVVSKAWLYLKRSQEKQEGIKRQMANQKLICRL